MSEENKPVFKGAWIPVEIWDADLSWIEKILWGMVSCLGKKSTPCKASNRYFAEKLKTSPGSVAVMLSKLRKMGLIQDISFDGRCREMLAVVPDEAFSPGLMLPLAPAKPCLELQLNPDGSSNKEDRKEDKNPDGVPRSQKGNLPAVGQPQGEDSFDAFWKAYPKGNLPAVGQPQGEDSFDAFWKAYPKQVAKADAVKAWKKVLKSKVPVAQVMAALDRFKKSYDRKRDPGLQYFPYPASWLNAERYLDEVTSAAVQPPTPKKPDVLQISRLIFTRETPPRREQFRAGPEGDGAFGTYTSAWRTHFGVTK